MATIERVWCGKFSQACAEKREGKQPSGSEKWVPCVEYWNSDPVLWPVKGIWLNVWGDVDVPELGWGESCCEGAGTYFKTRLFVLVKALRWQQHHWWFVMDKDWRVGLTHPLWWPRGGPGASLLLRMSSQHGAHWSRAFYFNTVFPNALLLSLSLSSSVSASVSFFSLSLYTPPSKKPQECCTAARKKKGHASFTVSPPLSAVPE